MTGVCLAAISILLFGWFRWPTAKPLHIYTAAERQAFITPLKAAQKGYIVWLSCPQAKEDICLLVGQFIDMFKEAGWTVKPETVRRDAPGIPLSGVRLVYYAPDPPQSPKLGEGVWTAQPLESLNLEEAFKALHIPTEGVHGATVPRDEIGIYFGPDT
jgi:hypothetical protein